MSNLELTIIKNIPAARETVFKAWLDSKSMARFMKPMSEMPDPEVEADGVEGGNFTIVMKSGDNSIRHTGTYKEVSEFERIVFTWISDHTQADSTVTLSFKELSPSETELTLHHVGFPSQESRDNHNGGWGLIVDTLTRLVA